jgi:acyl-coenzyme A thioesterase PaaI-like protein
MNDQLNAKAQKMLKDISNPWKLKYFLWQKLPSLLYWRIGIEHFDASRAAVSIPFTKKTQNPFRSIYFAAQAGAAEFYTGLLALLAIEGRGKVSMLVTDIRCEFHKKATETIVFSCNQGSEVYETVSKAIETKEGQKITLESEGKNSQGEVVTKVWIEWSFKVK